MWSAAAGFMCPKKLGEAGVRLLAFGPYTALDLSTASRKLEEGTRGWKRHSGATTVIPTAAATVNHALAFHRRGRQTNVCRQAGSRADFARGLFRR